MCVYLYLLMEICIWMESKEFHKGILTTDKPGRLWLHVALLWKCHVAGRELKQLNEDSVLERDEMKIRIAHEQGGYSSSEQEEHWLCSLVDYLRNAFCFPLTMYQTAGRRKNAVPDT